MLKEGNSMINLTLPLENANIIIALKSSEGHKYTEMYLAALDERYLGSMRLEYTKKIVKKIKDKFEQYLNGTLYTEYNETDLFASSETLINATFVYKDLNPRVKIYICHYELKQTEILEFRINDEMMKEWIKQLDHILSLLESCEKEE